MKRIFSILLALALCVGLLPAMISTAEAADVTINATNFPDETFRTYVKDNFDTDGNGKLSASEIAAVTEINVDGGYDDNYQPNGTITSIKGVEYFTALEHLRCGRNQLTALDVSKNTKLVTLDCTYDRLTVLDVSRNTALKYLYCGGSQLTSLDVSRNTALEQLDCAGTWLTSLDVSKNTKLSLLYCGSNKLTSLDVSKNTALEYLSCESNQLTTLDVSKNTALEWLYCSRNQLTSLDVSRNTALIQLRCFINQLTSLDVSKNAALDILQCGNNQLTTLDVSKNPSLTYLECSNMQLTTLDVSKNAALTALSCGENQLTVLDVSKNTALYALTCYGNSITKLDISSCPNLLDAHTNGTKSENTYDDVVYWEFVSANGRLRIDPATIIITVAKPAITTQPKSISAAIGDTAVFKITATGAGLTYQWQYYTGSKWVNSGLTGNKTATLKVPVTEARNGQKYRCVVTDANGNKVTSSSAKLTVKIDITKQPSNITAPIGDTAVFKITATGVGLTYQWQYKAPGSDNWVNSTATGAKTTSLKVSVTEARNGQKYRCIVKDANGKQYTSDAARLYVKTVITTQPHNISVAEGGKAVFKVAASGAGLTYQWQYYTGSKWVNSGLTGNKTAKLTVTATAARNGQQYRCVITDANGKTTTSSTAKLTVT